MNKPDRRELHAHHHDLRFLWSPRPCCNRRSGNGRRRTTAEVTAGDLCCGISGAFDGGEELRPVWLGLQAETRAEKLPALPATAAEGAALSSRQGASTSKSARLSPSGRGRQPLPLRGARARVDQAHGFCLCDDDRDHAGCAPSNLRWVLQAASGGATVGSARSDLPAI